MKEGFQVLGLHPRFQKEPYSQFVTFCDGSTGIQFVSHFTFG